MRPFIALAFTVLGGAALRAEDPKLAALDLPGYAKEIAKLKGKPVVVDFWATWCVPCREKFPKFVALAAKHKGAAAFVTVSIDDADAHDEALKFLVKQQATTANLRLTADADDIGKELGVKGVPRYLVYDAAGAIAYTGEDFAKAEAKLAELLAAAPGK